MNRALTYLNRTKILIIKYLAVIIINSQQAFLCASNAVFANNCDSTTGKGLYESPRQWAEQSPREQAAKSCL
jgi:hypothetical protein